MEITDFTNRECNITIQGHTDTTTLSMILAPDTAWEYKPDLVTLTAFHTRDDRLRNQQNIHNITYLNLPPTTKKPLQQRDIQPDISTQKPDQINRAIIALTQQFPNTDYFNETLVITEEEANEISQLIATDQTGPSHFRHQGSQHSQHSDDNINIDLPSTGNSDQDSDNENESTYSTT